MFNALTGTYLGQDHRLIRLKIFWDDGQDVAADDLMWGIAEDAFRCRVPAGDDAIQVFGDYGIFRGFDQRGVTQRRLLVVHLLRDVTSDLGRTNDLAL